MLHAARATSQTKPLGTPLGLKPVVRLKKQLNIDCIEMQSGVGDGPILAPFGLVHKHQISAVRSPQPIRCSKARRHLFARMPAPR